MIDITVIVPAFNSSKTILKCLDSLKQCSISNYEIIVINDCSSDDTSDIVNKYIFSGNSNVRLFTNSENLGPSYSRRNGIEEAKGGLLAFVDSDDYVEPGFLDTLYHTYKCQEADIIVFDHYVLKKGRRKSLHSMFDRSEIIDNNSRLLLPIDSFWTCFVRRELFERLEFPNIKNGEDMAIIPQLLSRAERIYYLSKPLYNYVYYSSSLSNAYSESKVKSLIESFDIIYSNLGSIYPREVEYLGIRNLVYGGLLANFKHKGNRFLANKLLDDFESKYQNWIESSYICHLPFYKRIFVKNAKKRRWFIIKCLSMIHTILLG